MSDKQKTLEVAAAVIIHDRKVLLARRKGGYLHDLWEFPGGKLENDESAACAAKRELMEELTTSVHPGKTILILEHDYPDKRVRLHFVECSLTGGSSDHLQKKISTDLARWFDPDSFPLSDLCPADRIAALRIPWHKININEERND